MRINYNLKPQNKCNKERILARYLTNKHRLQDCRKVIIVSSNENYNFSTILKNIKVGKWTLKIPHTSDSEILIV